MVKTEKIKEKFKKRRNFKARHNEKTLIDKSEQKKVGKYFNELISFYSCLNYLFMFLSIHYTYYC